MLAAKGHLIVVLFIILFIIISGFIDQRNAQSGPQQHSISTSYARQFLINSAWEWVFLIYVWAGVRRKGGRLADLTGGRWTSWQSLAKDIAIFISFWIVWTLTARSIYWLIGPSAGRGANYVFPPHGIPDISAWLVLSLTAGFCEEIIYRGYLQKQFYAFSGSVWFAVLAQALLFGAVHLYQGPKSVVVICVLGLLYGVLAQWQGHLRSSIMSHAWSDIFEGYVKFLLPAFFR